FPRKWESRKINHFRTPSPVQAMGRLFAGVPVLQISVKSCRNHNTGEKMGNLTKDDFFFDRERETLDWEIGRQKPYP
ncbi:MAG: hypothetical protein V1897_03640, partial [Pseudomonadota bacterium]